MAEHKHAKKNYYLWVSKLFEFSAEVLFKVPKKNVGIATKVKRHNLMWYFSVEYKKTTYLKKKL